MPSILPSPFSPIFPSIKSTGVDISAPPNQHSLQFTNPNKDTNNLQVNQNLLIKQIPLTFNCAEVEFSIFRNIVSVCGIGCVGYQMFPGLK